MRSSTCRPDTLNNTMASLEHDKSRRAAAVGAVGAAALILLVVMLVESRIRGLPDTQQAQLNTHSSSSSAPYHDAVLLELFVMSR